MKLQSSEVWNTHLQNCPDIQNKVLRSTLLRRKIKFQVSISILKSVVSFLELDTRIFLSYGSYDYFQILKQLAIERDTDASLFPNLEISFDHLIELSRVLQKIVRSFPSEEESSFPFCLSEDEHLSLYSHFYSMDNLCHGQLDCHRYILYKQISTRQLLLLVSNRFSHFRLNPRINSHPSAYTDNWRNSTCRFFNMQHWNVLSGCSGLSRNYSSSCYGNRSVQ